MKTKLFLAVVTILQLQTYAQSSNHFGLFPTIDHSGTISKKLDYSLYYFGGVNLINEKVNGIEDPANFFVFYAEQALTYKVNPHLAFTGSYVYERQHPTEDNFRNENRFYVQGTYKYDLNRTTLKHRLRYDGRFIESRATGESPYTSRLRYLFGITTPLKKTSDKLYFSAYNEFFFNTYKYASAIYGENWAYAGVGIRATKTSTFEAGPLYIFWVNKEMELTNFLYLQITWLTHINLKKQ